MRIGLPVPAVRVHAAGRIGAASVQATSVRHPVDAQRAALAGQEDQTLLCAYLMPGQFSRPALRASGACVEYREYCNRFREAAVKACSGVAGCSRWKACRSPRKSVRKV